MSAESTDNSLSITEAAQKLGLTRDGVYKKIRRGSLTGYKTPSGQWRVHLPDKLDGHTPDDSEPTRPVSEELLSQLRRENERLWKEVEGRRDAERELRLIIARLSDRPPQLSSGEPDVAADGALQPHSRRRWWRFWETQ